MGQRRNQRGIYTGRWMKMKTQYNKIWDAAEVVLRGNFIAMNTFFF